MRRGSRTQLVLLAVVAGVLAQLGAVAVNAMTSAAGRWPGGLDLIRRYPFWSALALTAAVVVIGAVSALRQQSGGDGPDAPALPPVPGWVIGRPAELDRIVRALRRGGDDPVAITTAVRGAGGFGKTILAALVCADRRVRRRFRGRIYVVTMGRDVRGRASIAAKVGEATRFITGDRETFSDPQLAGAHLGRLLSQLGRCLLVVDDVWEEEQVAPFLIGGRRCARLVTTRIPSAVPAAAAVVVDQMTPEQAERVLTWELPSLPPEFVELLPALTGRWPLLLRLANRAMAAEVATGRSAEDSAVDLAEALRAGGPAAVDDLAGRVGALDMDAPDERVRAVRATIEASAGGLRLGGRRHGPGGRRRPRRLPVPIPEAMMTRSDWFLVGAPWDCSGSGRGEMLAPGALRQAGLTDLVDVDLGDAATVIAGSHRDEATGVRALADTIAAARELATALGTGVRDHPGRRPLVVGGDCSLLLGVFARARGDLGLWMVDGHPDYFDAPGSDTGETADLELAVLTGDGPGALVGLGEAAPMVAARHVALIGHRTVDLDPASAAELARLPADMFTLDAGTVLTDPPGAGARAAAWADRLGIPMWLHVDVDVLDPSSMPAVTYPQAGGPDLDQLAAVLTPLAASPNLRGVSIADFRPDLDPDGSHAARLVDLLRRIL